MAGCRTGKCIQEILSLAKVNKRKVTILVLLDRIYRM